MVRIKTRNCSWFSQPLKINSRPSSVARRHNWYQGTRYAALCFVQSCRWRGAAAAPVRGCRKPPGRLASNTERFHVLLSRSGPYRAGRCFQRKSPSPMRDARADRWIRRFAVPKKSPPMRSRMYTGGSHGPARSSTTGTAVIHAAGSRQRARGAIADAAVALHARRRFGSVGAFSLGEQFAHTTLGPTPGTIRQPLCPQNQRRLSPPNTAPERAESTHMRVRQEGIHWFSFFATVSSARRTRTW